MSRITLSRLATRDLSAIWSYVATDDLAAADRLLDTLNDQIGLLADHPLLGRARPDIAPDLRYLVAGNYLILYRLIDTDVEVVRVLHGARDLPTILHDQ